MGAHAPKAVVQPQVLRWLRTTSGLSVEQTAKKLNTKPDNVIAWEAGEKQPSMPQVRNLAKAFKRPISYFYLPKPVKEPSIPHDFRRLPGAVPCQYSPELLYEIRLAFRRRLFAIDLAKEIGDRAVNFDEYGSVSLERSPEDVAKKIRTLLAVTLHEQKTLREPYTAYKFWRTKIEALGVFVFQATTIDLQQMLGFSLAYSELPVIVVNRKLKPNGRTFSMLHEFVHLMVGESGVCDIDDGLPRNQREQRVEVFCNHVAGATLVPKNELLAHFLVTSAASHMFEWDDDSIQTIARDFGASEEVIVRRLLVNGRVSQDYYVRKRAQYHARLTRRDRDENSSRDFKRNMPLEACE